MERRDKRPWWSVRISGVLWLLFIIFGSLGLVAIAAGGVWVISANWITPGERRAALHALDCVDDVKQAGAIDESAYQARVQKADDAVKKVNKSAFTLRDRAIASSIESQLILATEPRMKGAASKLLKDRGFTPPDDPLTEAQRAQLDQLDISLEKSLRETLGSEDSGK